MRCVRDRWQGIFLGAQLAAGLLVAGLPSSGLAAEAGRDIAIRQDRLARDPAILRLPGLDSDPLISSTCPHDDRSGLCHVKEVAPAAAGDAPTWLVQVSDRPMDALPALTASGAEIVGYYPNAAWLVRAPQSVLGALSQLPSVRWIGAWSPAWKPSPGLLSRGRVGEEESVLLAVRFQPGSPLAPWKAHLEATPGATIHAMHESDTEPSIGSVVLALPPEDVASATRWLASLRDVMSIEEQTPTRPFLDSAVPWSQTGIDAATDYDVSAKLFRKGITGRGILVGLPDDGLENDDCRFLYDGGTDEAAWPLGPSSDSATPVVAETHFAPGQPAPIRTRERKVTAYLVQRGAVAYSSDEQHGSAVAACIAGDANDVLAARPLIRDVGDAQDVFPMNRMGEWLVGEELRPALLPRVDDPAMAESTFPTTFGARVQHHEAGDGAAPGAQLIVQDIGQANGSLVPVFADLLMRQAHRFGATAFNVSWGAAPCVDCYSGHARDADDALWYMRDLTASAAVGNDGALGPGAIGHGFAHAKSATSVGATAGSSIPSCAGCVPANPRRGEDRAAYSSLGPSSGGRLAPEILMPGDVVAPFGGPLPSRTPEDGSGSGDFGCAPPDASAGTSFAAGQATGLAALVQQYFRDGYYPTGMPVLANQLRPTNALIRAVMVNSSRDLVGLRTDDAGTGRAHRPNFAQGWGAPRLDDTLYFAGDPSADDPLGDTERARFVVLTDTPNGFDGSFPLSLEPGGRTRDATVSNFRTALTDGAVAEFIVNVANPDPTRAANELRFTLAWSDSPALSASAPLVNDLDLEIVSPGPDGILQSITGASLLGDDIVYRPNPLVAWSVGTSVPSPMRRLQMARLPFDSMLADADRLNTVENVFVPASDVAAGIWRIRVIGYRVPGGLGTQDARPNFAVGDRPPVLDLDGDGVAETDIADSINSTDQGYALIASGNFAAPPVSWPPRIPVPPWTPPRRPPGPPDRR